MFATPLLRAARHPTTWSAARRAFSSAPSRLPNNEHIYVFPTAGGRSILTLLPTSPPTPSLAIGTTTAIPPTPSSFTENPAFLRIAQSVLSKHATADPDVKAQAAVFASTAGSSLGGGAGGPGGMVFPANHPSRRRERQRGQKAALAGKSMDSGGAGGASSQGGVGGAGRGGWVHVSDARNPPDFGRIAWPEDIFGSVEVDGEGNFVGENGNYQESGTYRIVTNQGILGLSPYLREKVVERLQKLEKDQ